MTNPPGARTTAGDLDRVLAYTLSMVDWAQMYNTDPDSFDMLRRLLEFGLPDAIEDRVQKEVGVALIRVTRSKKTTTASPCQSVSKFFI